MSLETGEVPIPSKAEGQPKRVESISFPERKVFKPELSFFVTDHSGDILDIGHKEEANMATWSGIPDTEDEKSFRELCRQMKEIGVNSIRFDIRWNLFEKDRGQYDFGQLKRYLRAREIMREAGLGEPTIILSSLPKWAVDLYHRRPEVFFLEWEKYVTKVRNGLVKLETHDNAKGDKILDRVNRVQILNELNNKVYTPIGLSDIPRLCEITRKVFSQYNPNIQLMATFLAGNFADYGEKFGQAIGVDKFLPELKRQAADQFDIIAVDYYPGVWHLPFRDIGLSWRDIIREPELAKELLKGMYRQTGLLKEVFEELASWGKPYELGEVGLPSKLLWGGEEGQRFFYDTFFRNLRHLIVDLAERGITPPEKIGIYQMRNDPVKSKMGQILRKTPFPEFDFGLYDDKDRKLIMRGKRHWLGTEEEGPPQLKRIIDYMRRSIDLS